MLQKLLSKYGYAFGYILNAGFNFLLAIFLTNYLTKDDFGNYSIYRAAIFTLWPFIGVSTHFFLQVEFFKEKKDKFQTLVFSSIFLNFLLFLLVETIAFLFVDWISNFLEIDQFWILTIPFIAFLLSLVKIGLVMMQVKKELGSFLLISVSQVSINLFITYYLVVLSSLNWEGRAYGLFFSNIIAAFLVIGTLKKQEVLKFEINKRLLIKALKFGLAAIMLDICIVLIAFSDKIFIKRFVSTESLGVYAVALQLAAVIGVLDSAFTESLYPKMYNWLSKGHLKKVQLITIQYLVGLAIFAFMYSLIAPYLYSYFISSDFAESFSIMRWIIMALWCLSLYKIHVSRIYYYNKAKKLIYPSLFIIVINILSHFYLVPKFGVIGAIFTNIISYALLSLAVYILLKLIYSKQSSK